jgi:signal transduction histidine kinase
VATADLQRTLTTLVRACDAVYGTTSIALALLAIVEYCVGGAHLGIVIALWAVPVFNLSWSYVTRNRDRVAGDTIRALACVPLVAYIYAAEPSGILREMWLPALMVSVAGCVSVSIGTRRASRGITLALLYGGGLLLSELIAYQQFDAPSVADAVALLLASSIMSLLAAQFGGTIGQLTDRSAELTIAIQNVHREMERRTALEAELVQAQKLESVGRLAAGIAHEINTPVQFVSDSLHFVRDAVTELFSLVGHVQADDAKDADLPYLSEEVPKALARAEDGLDRVSTIVRSMNQFAHPDSNEMLDVDLNRSIAATLVLATNEYKYVAKLETDFGELPMVSCYAGELNQAVLNIVINAAHAIGDIVGDTGALGSISVSTRRMCDAAVIQIRDTGGGIPDTIRSRVFDPFFTTKGVGRGTGQGLALARAVVVDKHHGKLSFESEPGVGTTFTIEVPLAGVRAVA